MRLPVGQPNSFGLPTHSSRSRSMQTGITATAGLHEKALPKCPCQPWGPIIFLHQKCFSCIRPRPEQCCQHPQHQPCSQELHTGPPAHAQAKGEPPFLQGTLLKLVALSSGRPKVCMPSSVLWIKHTHAAIPLLAEETKTKKELLLYCSGLANVSVETISFAP